MDNIFKKLWQQPHRLQIFKVDKFHFVNNLIKLLSFYN